jgi:hypothetical protein
MINKIDNVIDKLNKKVTEKSEKIMTNEKVEGFINNIGGVLCFAGAVVFGILFIVCGASLMKTGKNYVVKPVAEEKKAEESSSETAPAEEGASESTSSTESAASTESTEATEATEAKESTEATESTEASTEQSQ